LEIQSLHGTLRRGRGKRGGGGGGGEGGEGGGGGGGVEGWGEGDKVVPCLTHKQNFCFKL